MSQPSEHSPPPVKPCRWSAVTALNQIQRLVWVTSTESWTCNAYPVSGVSAQAGSDICYRLTPCHAGARQPLHCSVRPSASQRSAPSAAAEARRVPPFPFTHTPLGGSSRPIRLPAAFKMIYSPLFAKTTASGLLLRLQHARINISDSWTSSLLKNWLRAHRFTENSSAAADFLLDETQKLLRAKIKNCPRPAPGPSHQRAGGGSEPEQSTPRNSEKALHQQRWQDTVQKN